MAIILSGKELASAIKNDASKKVAELKKVGIVPSLAILLIGDDSDSKRYVELKAKQCREVGAAASIHQLDAEISAKELKDRIKKLNSYKSVHGILIQLPVPQAVSNAIDSIDVEKDVDGLTSSSLGRILQGREGYAPAGAEAIIEILSNYEIDIHDKYVVIIGASNILGKPLASLLTNGESIVTVVPSYHNAAKYTKNADIVVVDVGKAKSLTAEMVSRKCVVIDAGNNYVNDKLVGDADFESLKEFVYAITPVPGGVGPMLVAVLIKNLVRAAEKVKRAN